MKVSKEAETDPNVKADAAKWFKRMEDGDEEALKNWRKWRELSAKKYAEEYEGLNVFFDVYTGESEVKQETIALALEKLTSLGLIQDADGGGQLIDLEKYKLGKAIIKKKGQFAFPSFRISLLFRWDFNISHSRHRWCYRPIRQIQV